MAIGCSASAGLSVPAKPMYATAVALTWDGAARKILAKKC